MVTLDNITSVGEISFAVNSILGYLILEYRKIYAKSIHTVLTQSVGEQFSNEDNCFILENGNKFSKKRFNEIQTIFKIVVSLSLFAIVLSFLVLSLSAIYPKYEINTYFYMLCATLFMLINPILYFLYRSKIIIFEKELDNNLINEDEMTSYMKNYIPMPKFKQPIHRRLKWFLRFKVNTAKYYIEKFIDRVKRNK